MRPLIGLTGNHSEIDVTLRDAYHKQIVEAGGIPVIIPPVDDEEVIINTVERLDGLVLTGGGDFDPKWFGEEPHPKLGTINAVRDHAELLITRHAYNRNIPMLGICRGVQTIAIALEGHIAQDISDKTTHNHSQTEDRPVTTHEVNINDGSTLSEIYSSLFTLHSSLKVNSFHHQAVDNPGKKFRTIATAPDGIIEAMESTEHKAILGVQWHPEWLGKDGLPIFQWLVKEARTFMEAKALHKRIITLDTHCDTPMFFPQGIDFLKRDPRILVDLPKMTEGHQDATIMVAYIPQNYKDGSPKDYADRIFDKIGEIVSSAPDRLAFGRTEEDILRNKKEGKKSILLGIENGLAIEDDIKNLKHFADRGIVYMTLCHNGDNLICDSAKGNNTHGGVSEYGERVIQEMNRLGIMVDLSHGGEKSFYDALEISKTPIVCSHSNCKALCDHPRNLTDDQLRAIAKAGGVAHTTFYPGFLKKDGEASILDGIAHLEHAIKVMGIDHVGIGTDFDGDGGVPGMACSSDAINFTMHLLRKRFSEEDIRKIWGGNWLRVMKQVQSFVMSLLVCVMLFSCGSKQPVTESSLVSTVFNEDSAYAFCAAQCQFGPRTMNSESHEKCAEWIIEKFKSYGCTVMTQKADLRGWDGTMLHATNIIASINPNITQRYMLCAHWDSRPWADNDPDEKNHHTPVMAANDGASGVGVMLEIARIAGDSIGIDFICFDAEDYGSPQWSDSHDDNSWALGAQYFAQQYVSAAESLPAHMRNGWAGAVLLDMVGGQGAHFYQEGLSMRYAPDTMEKVWQAAAEAGYGSYFLYDRSGTVTDDHKPLNEAGIPTIDIIPYYPDCEQSSFGPTWHTIYDDMDHIDKLTLKAVGQTLIQYLCSQH